MKNRSKALKIATDRQGDMLRVVRKGSNTIIAYTVSYMSLQSFSIFMIIIFDPQHVHRIKTTKLNPLTAGVAYIRVFIFF